MAEQNGKTHTLVGNFKIETLLTVIFLLFGASLLVSCGGDETVVHYQCKEESGNIRDLPANIGSGEDLYLGYLQNSQGSCMRFWSYVSPGGGSQYDCYIDGKKNSKVSKTQPYQETWGQGTCSDLGRPTTPSILTISPTGNVQWTASSGNRPGTPSSPPDVYVIVTATIPINDDLFKAKIAANQHKVVFSTGSPTESYALNLSAGNYYVRLRAENQSPSATSNLSPEKSFSIVTGSASFYPNPIAKSGPARMKLILSDTYSGDFSDLTLQINSISVPVSQDFENKRVFYFRPPKPSNTSPITVRITSSATGTVNLSSAISVTQDNLEQTNSVLQGSLVDIEEAYSDTRKAGTTGETGLEDFLDLGYHRMDLSTDVLGGLWLARDNSSATQKQVEYIFQSIEAAMETKLDVLSKGFGTVVAKPAAKQAAGEPQFGSAAFYKETKDKLATNTYFFTMVNDVAVVAIQSELFEVGVYVNQVVGNTITEAAAANPDAHLILNGSMFNYKNEKKEPVYYEPMISNAILINAGAVQPTSCAELGQPPTEGCQQGARWRWWFGQQFDGTYAYGGRVKQGTTLITPGHPPLPHIPSQAMDLKAAIGGLYIYIANRASQPGGTSTRHIILPSEDNDLNNLYGRLGPLMGFGGIAFDNETKVLLIFSKKQGKIAALKEFVQKLFDMGTDWAVGTDGGASTALAIKNGSGFDFPIRSGKRHTDSDRPDNMETLTNYFIFKLK